MTLNHAVNIKNMIHMNKQGDWQLPIEFINVVVTWSQFRDFVTKGLGMRTNNWALSWRTKYKYSMISLKTAIVVNKNARNGSDDYVIASNKLQWIVDKVAELNDTECEEINGDILFYGFDIISYVND
eukprot:474518_1